MCTYQVGEIRHGIDTVKKISHPIFYGCFEVNINYGRVSY